MKHLHESAAIKIFLKRKKIKGICVWNDNLGHYQLFGYKDVTISLRCNVAESIECLNNLVETFNSK